MLTEITKLVTVILAISLASERLVVFLKTLIPGMAEKSPADQSIEPEKSPTRRLIVMTVAFLAAWLSSAFLVDKDFLLGSVKISDTLSIPCPLMGLLASGGSAFWTNIVAYMSALKDINKQRVAQEKLATNEMVATLKINVSKS